MSGHSKWATTKHKKAVIDAKRGKLFAKLIKNIEVAARTGGGDPGGNPTLYDAIQKARKNSVPLDNIDRAVKRGSGAEAGGSDYQTIMYEAYGPAGVAVLAAKTVEWWARRRQSLEPPFTVGEVRILTRGLSLDLTRAHTELGYWPVVETEAGLRAAIDALRPRRAAP